MNIQVLGINHKTAPIEIREKFYLNPHEQDLLLSELKSHPAIIEAFVISTCNRTEIYTHSIDVPSSVNDLLDLIANVKKVPNVQNFIKHFYHYSHKDAVEHFLNVASGLDSLVLGEKQIIGQVKIAINRARERAMLNKTLNVLSNVAIRTGKKVQHETDISAGGSSIGWAAIQKAEQSLGTLENKTVLVIGAGKMGELALEQMENKGVAKIYLMNRTAKTALDMANRRNATAASFYDIKEILAESDICVCSVGAPHYILDKDVVEKVMPTRSQRHLTLLDISMPRNIDPDIAQIPNTSLFCIDDLQEVVKENLRRRESAVEEVEKIVQSKVHEFYQKIEKLKSYSSEYEIH